MSGVAQAKLDAALRRDQAFAKARGKHSHAHGLKSSISKEAFFNAIRTEGREVMTPAGDGYWRDMERRYPHLNLSTYTDSGDSPNGHRCRHGKVSQRFIPGKGWFDWVDSIGWVPQAPKGGKQ